MPPPATDERVSAVGCDDGLRFPETVASAKTSAHAPPPIQPRTKTFSFAAKVKGRVGRPADVPVRSFQHALHGRLLLRKGNSPRFASDLYSELNSLWNPTCPWQIIPLGRGFSTLKFSASEDSANAFAKSSWRLSTGILHFQAWVPNFVPYKATSTLSQVWIRVFNLPHEYWHPEVLSSIARHIGTPIIIDVISANVAVGHFARILVEIDVFADVPDVLDVNCGEKVFAIEFGYENLPYFCQTCNVVGHDTNVCRRNISETEPPTVVTTENAKGKTPTLIRKDGWRRVPSKNAEIVAPLVTSNKASPSSGALHGDVTMVVPVVEDIPIPNIASLSLG
ncbi:uncharacterized protein LOC130994294 [Salvia miltiorrhiza]|uniref:uncharacterized protein LOC130994294 n=1 Tax=Salvia miltiorrhiza TaxID=226208 RepID=UPI0025AD07A1|nr:uncharacterized protein LOC130994294 [Salvia miltiorrhiza]